MQRNSIQEWKFVPTQFQSFILLHSFLLNIKKKLNGQRQLRFGFYISILARKFKFSRAFTILQSVWKSPKLSHMSFSILTFSTNFCPIKIDQSGNTVWPIASDFQKLVKIHHIWLFYELLSTPNVNFARLICSLQSSLTVTLNFCSLRSYFAVHNSIFESPKSTCRVLLTAKVVDGYLSWAWLSHVLWYLSWVLCFASLL